jgi:putative acetyltransferase
MNATIRNTSVMTAPTDILRLARPEDRRPMLELWERAVRATHDFLTESAIVELRPAVADVLASDALQWWVCDRDGGIAGFLGLAANSVEALFVDPAHHRRGIGRLFIAHAQQVNDGEALLVDVNEANAGALTFYQRLGFGIIGRSATDGDGRPYPLLHMRRVAQRRDTP